VKISIQNAVLILAMGMLLVIIGAVLALENSGGANISMIMGLVLVFFGSVWFVFGLNQRKKNK
jgi:uncharacterized membrane protein HdeD (DUF308 family)